MVIFGGMFSLVALAGAFGSSTSGAAGFGAILGVGSIVIFPSLYGGMATEP